MSLYSSCLLDFLVACSRPVSCYHSSYQFFLRPLRFRYFTTDIPPFFRYLSTSVDVDLQYRCVFQAGRTRPTRSKSIVASFLVCCWCVHQSFVFKCMYVCVCVLWVCLCVCRIWPARGYLCVSLAVTWLLGPFLFSGRPSLFWIIQDWLTRETFRVSLLCLFNNLRSIFLPIFSHGKSIASGMLLDSIWIEPFLFFR